MACAPSSTANPDQHATTPCWDAHKCLPASPACLISKMEVSNRSCQAVAPVRSVASMNAVPSLLPWWGNMGRPCVSKPLGAQQAEPIAKAKRSFPAAPACLLPLYSTLLPASFPHTNPLNPTALTRMRCVAS